MNIKAIEMFLNEYRKKESLVVELKDRRTFRIQKESIKIEYDTLFGYNYNGIRFFDVAIDCNEIATLKWSDKK